MALGLDPTLFWDLTPREIATIGAGAQERRRTTFNDTMRATYWGGLIAHVKDPPKLDELLMKSSTAPRKQSWQAIKAAFQAAMPPEENKHG